jgi:hypothetical protein
MHEWFSGVGDQSLVGWLITLGYMLGAFLCLRAASGGGGEEARLWLCIGVAFLLLGVNKQLDLHSLLTRMLRDLARSGGWYEDRRTLQAIFIAFVMLAAFLAMAKLIRRFRRSRPAVRLGIFGVTCTLLFVVVRAASFHHADELLRLELEGVKAHAAIELLGVLTVVAAALLYKKQHGSIGARDRSEGTTFK